MFHKKWDWVLLSSSSKKAYLDQSSYPCIQKQAHVWKGAAVTIVAHNNVKVSYYLVLPFAWCSLQSVINLNLFQGDSKVFQICILFPHRAFLWLDNFVGFDNIFWSNKFLVENTNKKIQIMGWYFLDSNFFRFKVFCWVKFFCWAGGRGFGNRILKGLEKSSIWKLKIWFIIHNMYIISPHNTFNNDESLIAILWKEENIREDQTDGRTTELSDDVSSWAASRI